VSDMPPLDEGLSDRLGAALGQLAAGCKTASDVAGKLAKVGCKGERGDTCNDPVSDWLNQRVTIPSGCEISVGIDNAEVLTRREGDGVLIEVAVAAVPAVVASLIVAFDSEDVFPELVQVAPEDGEHFEVYACGDGPAAYDSRPFGRPGHDDAMTAAREASRSGRKHVVERVTIQGGLIRRNRIAEYRNGELVS
jgi:hypothetical protein